MIPDLESRNSPLELKNILHPIEGQFGDPLVSLQQKFRNKNIVSQHGVKGVDQGVGNLKVNCLFCSITSVPWNSKGTLVHLDLLS